MAKFNLTTIVPDGFLHSQAFAEVRDSLAWSLSALGHDVSTTQNWFSEVGETNIILGAELIAGFTRLPRNTILYNLEQPSHPNMDTVRRLARESGCSVWDYSSRAVEEWRSAGFPSVQHVPIGYTPNLTRIPRADSPDIDVLFLGWMTPRRIAMIEALHKNGLRVVASASCYGGARDNLISRSRVCLNLHHDGRDRFEIVRCSYLMANSKCVVTENSADDDEYQDLARGLSIVPYRLLVDSCVTLARADSARAAQEDHAAGAIAGRDFTAAVEAALDGQPPSPSRPLIHALERKASRDSYLAEARSLSSRPRDPRVAARYVAATRSGDMKDFVTWMRHHARGNIVEIGVRDGASTSAFLSGVEEYGGHVYSIDVQPCGGLFDGHPQWSFLQANSFDLQAVIRFIPFEIDVLLIDGDHSRAGVLNDFEFQRQVRAGGLILFHDIAPEEKPSGCNDMSWPGDDVRRVYYEICAESEKLGWTHEELPGRYGMGVLTKGAMTPPEAIQATETTEAKVK